LVGFGVKLTLRDVRSRQTPTRLTDAVEKVGFSIWTRALNGLLNVSSGSLAFDSACYALRSRN
jgi:hypothetical protein